jgi:REP element-mobilizing transposase RayT
MTSYRRNFVPGGSFFFTVNLADRRQSLLTAHIGLLRAAFRETRERHPFTIDAIVVLPEHLHTVWSMPDGDADFATRWRQIKSASLATLLLTNRFHQVALPEENEASGSAAIGSTPSGMRRTMSGTSTMCISIRSSMVWSSEYAIGVRRRSIGM